MSKTYYCFVIFVISLIFLVFYLLFFAEESDRVKELREREEKMEEGVKNKLEEVKDGDSRYSSMIPTGKHLAIYGEDGSKMSTIDIYIDENTNCKYVFREMVRSGQANGNITLTPMYNEDGKIDCD